MFLSLFLSFFHEILIIIFSRLLSIWFGVSTSLFYWNRFTVHSFLAVVSAKPSIAITTISPLVFIQIVSHHIHIYFDFFFFCFDFFPSRLLFDFNFYSMIFAKRFIWIWLVSLVFFFVFPSSSSPVCCCCYSICFVAFVVITIIRCPLIANLLSASSQKSMQNQSVSQCLFTKCSWWTSIHFSLPQSPSPSLITLRLSLFLSFPSSLPHSLTFLNFSRNTHNIFHSISPCVYESPTKNQNPFHSRNEMIKNQWTEVQKKNENRNQKLSGKNKWLTVETHIGIFDESILWINFFCA